MEMDATEYGNFTLKLCVKSNIMRKKGSKIKFAKGRRNGG
jgi:hypothetical protein